MRNLVYLKTLATVMLATIMMTGAMNATSAVPTTTSTTMTLSRLTLINVNDAAGVWQHEGGKVFQGAVQIGNYAAHRRVTSGGTDAQNTAMLTLTIFFNSVAGSAQQNLTILGSHDFSSGRYVGSVSAASSTYKLWIDANVSGSATTSTLTLSKP